MTDPRRRQRVNRAAPGGWKEDTVNATFVTLALSSALGVALLVQPASAQSARIHVGATVAVSPGQYGSQYPPPATRGYGYPPGRGEYYGRADYALSNGYRDGYEKGFDDARDRDRYDVRRHRWYRDGDRGYRRDYDMGRHRYRDAYRRGFANGYDEGYRAAARGYGRGGRAPYRDEGSRGGVWFDWRF